MENIVCNSCGTVNESGTVKCVNCGNNLAHSSGAETGHAGLQSNTAPTPKQDGGIPASETSYYAKIGESRMKKEVDRTRTGLLLMTIGIFLSWIPLILYLGDLAIFVGAILMILGRNAFGEKHRTSVMLAVLIFIIGIIAEVVVGIFILSGVFSAINQYRLGNISQSALGSQISGAFSSYLIATVALSVFIAISYLLLAWQIEDNLGKRLLMVGYVGLIAVSIATYMLILPDITSFTNSLSTLSSANQITSAADSLESKINNYKLLGAIPNIIFAVAYYIAYKRVELGQVKSGH
ncbi:MAG: zinc finger Ran-binding domain-containing protein [Candidatus Thermoplasmatota archaeon]|nr:zinc finger Ran-binding domain-containing protein [Candidatus Thermoplasmatota archaeon]MCL5438010.1 zinc finger Ran-binding domain-containing protein [Candidatus Thermoplasmatota archaeon]